MALNMRITTLYGILISTALIAGCGKLNFFGDPDRSGYTAAEYYQEANEALQDNNYSKAIELYQELESTHPFGYHTEQAQLEIIFAYYKNENPEAALSAADRFIRLHPTHPNVDYAYYMKGLVNFTEDQSFIDKLDRGDSSPDRDPKGTLASYNAFQALVNKFPESRYAEDARKRMAFLHNTLAMHEIHVADYYLRRGAHVAVVNRGKHVLNEYPETPAVEHALGLMMLAYDRMGLNDLAQDSRRVLELNHPDSGYLSGSRPRIKDKFSLVPSNLNLNPFNWDLNIFN